MKNTFADVRRQAPSIHAVNNQGEIYNFCPSPQNAQYESRRCSYHSIHGDGSRKKPYYGNASPMSPHYFIVDLWFKFRPLALKKAKARFVWIEINDCLLQVKPDGVMAEDGHFTKLLVPNQRGRRR